MVNIYAASSPNNSLSNLHFSDKNVICTRLIRMLESVPNIESKTLELEGALEDHLSFYNTQQGPAQGQSFYTRTGPDCTRSQKFSKEFRKYSIW